MKKIFRKMGIAVAMYVITVAMITLGAVIAQGFVLQSWVECAELFWGTLFALSPVCFIVCASIYLYWEERLPPDEPIVY